MVLLEKLKRYFIDSIEFYTTLTKVEYKIDTPFTHDSLLSEILKLIEAERKTNGQRSHFIKYKMAVIDAAVCRFKPIKHRRDTSWSGISYDIEIRNQKAVLKRGTTTKAALFVFYLGLLGSIAINFHDFNSMAQIFIIFWVWGRLAMFNEEMFFIDKAIQNLGGKRSKVSHC